MQYQSTLEFVSDDELLRRLVEILGQSRRVEADLVAHLGEVDARRLFARAVPSMFAYATEILHLSEAEAYLRIAAARASREHPILLTMLEDGRLHLTAVAKLAPHLTPENRDRLLERAAHRTKRQVEELIAELAPRPDVPAVMRKLPSRPVGPTSRTPATDSSIAGREGEGARQLRPDEVGERGPELHLAGDRPPGLRLDAVEHHHGGLRPDQGPALRTKPPEAASKTPAPIPVRTSAPASIEPLAPGRYKVQFTAGAELRDKLDRLRALMRPSVPDGDLAALIDAAVTEKLERLEARRFARTKARRNETKAPCDEVQANRVPSSTRYVPAAVRRAVYERDGGRCRYVDEKGQRCTAREALEFHHRHPFAVGGEHTPQNLALFCKCHNRFVAEIDFGREAMTRHRHGGPPPRFASQLRGPQAS